MRKEIGDMLRIMRMLCGKYYKIKPEDFVIGTGKVNSVKKFLDYAFKYVGLDYKKFIKVDKRLFRPTDQVILCADNRKAFKKLKWKPKITFHQLIEEMVDYDINNS